LFGLEEDFAAQADKLGIYKSVELRAGPYTLSECCLPNLSNSHCSLLEIEINLGCAQLRARVCSLKVLLFLCPAKSPPPEKGLSLTE
jgi:hypothetical protein